MQKMMTILMPVVLLLFFKTSICMNKVATCRPFCDGGDCVTLNKDRVDFTTAEAACRDRNGELVVYQAETGKILLDILNQELFGSVWIGLRLPVGACSNLSAPLRGYEWTTRGVHSSFVPASRTWKDSVKVCSPRCVSLSNDQKWTERPCSDKTDGFLCRVKHRDACHAQELSESDVFISSQGCRSGPCEHKCIPVQGGYKCSCFDGYIPDPRNTMQCKIHCAQQECPAICQEGQCYCAYGYIISDNICHDIDECAMNKCDQECKNAFGSFECSCREGFVLSDQDKCKNASIIVPVDFEPVVNNSTLKGSSTPTGGLLWLWIFITVVVILSICAIRFYLVRQQKHREQHTTTQ